MGFTTLTLEKREGVAVITLNRPEVLNALNAQMGKDLGEAVANIRDDDEVRAVIFTGSGKAFCSGGDIKGMLSQVSKAAVVQRRDHLKFAYRWLADFINLEKPVIAAINGYAYGAGLSLALVADIIIAAESASFALSFAKVGLTPDFAGAYLLPRIIGMNKAKQYTLTGDSFDAKTAEEMGLVAEVVTDADLEQAAWKMARRLAQGPTKALGMTKVMLNRSFDTALTEFLDMEASYHAISGATEDFREGVQAFTEKRHAQFKGK